MPPVGQIGVQKIRGQLRIVSAAVGAGSGLLIGGPVAFWVLFGLETGFGRRIKRQPLFLYLAINVTAMAMLLLAGHLAAFHLLWTPPGGFHQDPVLLASLAFSVALMVTASVSIELRRLIGPGVFGAVLVGRYRYPRAERRLFLLMDIVGSTALAERLGPERFMAFLDRWIHTMTEPLLCTGARL